MDLTHRNLCELAVDWLRRPRSRSGPGCQVSFSESRGDWLGEAPDAIGFRAAVHDEASVLIEVKVSRSDFLADKEKPHRKDPAIGMGKFRYFMAPENLIMVNELPEKWGLIEVSDRGSLKVICGHVVAKAESIKCWEHEYAISREWTLLARVLNRVGDAEKLQNWLKEARNAKARLLRSNDELTSRVKTLSSELWHLKHSIEHRESSEVTEVAKRVTTGL